MEPDLSNITKNDYEHCYEPAEDSYLLADAIRYDLDRCVPDAWLNAPISESIRSADANFKRGLLENIPKKHAETENDENRPYIPLFCLEIGTGSGYVSACVGKLLHRSQFILTDVNELALKVAKRTCAENGIGVNACLLMDQLRTFRLIGVVDLLYWNPPYVPSDSCEMQGAGISRSWAGGRNGRELIDMFIPLVHRLLAPNGRFYLLLERQNQIENLLELCKTHRLEGYRVAQRQAFNEHLYVYRFAVTALA